MNRITLRGPADVPNAIAALIGFHPTESLVVLGVPGPTGRVDLDPANIADAVEAFGPAVQHWTGRVVVAVYGTDHALLGRALTALQEAYALDVALAVRVADGLVYDIHGNSAPASPVPASVAHLRIESDRAALVADAGEITTADLAWTLALAAYDAGAGARARCYLDRYVALNGGHSEASQGLEYALTAAVKPAALEG